MSESQEQIAFIRYCQYIKLINLVPNWSDSVLPRAIYDYAKNEPLSRFIFHIPNGGSRNMLEAVKLKRMGVKPGVPDLFFFLPTERYGGLFIEMKATSNGKVSAYQQEVMQDLISTNYECVVCNGFDEATKAITRYLLKQYS